MRYVLDTNTLSFLMRGERAVAGKLTSRARTDILLPQAVVAEIEYGLARLPQSARQRKLRQRFNLVLAENTCRVDG